MGCACLFAIIAAGAPRLALFLMWILRYEGLNRAFDSFIIPLLGFIFLPLTTVVYVLVYPGGLSTFNWILLIVAVLIDLGSYGSGARGRRRRRD
jgi:membrane protein required for beta-lactamase induction